MRIISWNCQGAFRLKNTEILKLNPDILIVLECEQGDKLQFGRFTKQPNDFFGMVTQGKKALVYFHIQNILFGC